MIIWLLGEPRPIHPGFRICWRPNGVLATAFKRTEATAGPVMRPQACPKADALIGSVEALIKPNDFLKLMNPLNPWLSSKFYINFRKSKYKNKNFMSIMMINTTLWKFENPI